MKRSAPTANARGTTSPSVAHSNRNKRRRHLNQLPSLAHPPQAKCQTANCLARPHSRICPKARLAVPLLRLLLTPTWMTLTKPFKCSWPTPSLINLLNMSLRLRPNCNRATCNMVSSLILAPPTPCAPTKCGSRTSPPFPLILKSS